MHIRLEERHAGRRFLVDAQEVDANVALHIRIRPTLDRRLDLELRLLVLRDGVKTRDMVVADALGDLGKSILLIELQLRRILDESEDEIALLEVIDRRLQRLRSTEHLRAREYDFRDAVVFQTAEHGIDIVGRATQIIRRTCEHEEAGVIDRLHLVRRHTEIHLEEGFVIRLDDEDFHAVDCDGVHTSSAQAAQQVLLDLLVGTRIMPDDTDVRSLDRTVLDEGAPRGIGQDPRMVIGYKFTSRERRRLSICVELLEGRLVDGERRDARFLRRLQHFRDRFPLLLGKLHEIFVVNGEIDLLVDLLRTPACDVDEERRDKADEDEGDEHLVVLKLLHVSYSSFPPAERRTTMAPFLCSTLSIRVFKGSASSFAI